LAENRRIESEMIMWIKTDSEAIDYKYPSIFSL